MPIFNLKQLKYITTIVAFIIFLSCSNENEVVNHENNLTNELKQNRTSESFKLEDFRTKKAIIENDLIAKEIYNLGFEYKNAIKMHDNENILIIHDRILIKIEELNMLYGKENLQEFYNEIILTSKTDGGDMIGGPDDDKCKRKADGTVNYSACEGFWENFLVTIRVGFCPTGNAEQLYNCAQDVVCKTC